MYRDLVFESAEHVFARKGYAEATMQDVASEAGISLRTLYGAFSGKSELYREIQEVRGRAFVQRVAQALAGGSDALEGLAAGVRAYVAFLLGHRDFLRIHLRERLAWGLGPRSGMGAERWHEGVEAVAGTIRRGIAEGSFHDGDPEVMAMMAIAIMQVQLARWAQREDPEQQADALAEEVVLQLRRLLCRPEAPARRRRVA